MRMGTQSLIQVIQAFAHHADDDSNDDDEDAQEDTQDHRVFDMYSSLNTVHNKPQTHLHESMSTSMSGTPHESQDEDEEAGSDRSAHSDDSELTRMRSQSLKKKSTQRRRNLSKKLSEIFDLDSQEDIKAEYRCSLLGSSYRPLLEGFLYSTNSFLCFFAHVPTLERNNVVKTGPIGKRTLRTRRVIRYWLALKDDVLSWFGSAIDPYFPVGNVALRYAIRCVTVKNSDREFTIFTSERKFTFLADSKTGRNEWVKVIRKGMFRSQNESGSFKLVIPYDHVINVERSSNLEFADSISVSFINNEDGADYYYFDHFRDSQSACNTLSEILETHRHDVHRILSNENLVMSPTKMKDEFIDGSEVTARPSSSGHIGNHTYPPSNTKNSRSRSSSLTAEIPSWIKSGSIKLGKVVYSAPRMIPHPHLSTILPKLPSIPFLNNNNSNQGRQQPLPNPALTNQLMRTNSRVYEHYEEPTNSRSNDNNRSRSNSGVAESDDEFEEVGSDFSVLEHSAGMEDILKVEEEVQRKFNDYFALPGEKILGHFNCALFRVYPTPGKVYITNNYLCFRSFQIWSRTKMILPLNDLQAVQPHKPLRFSFHGLIMIIHRHEELFLEFTTSNRRDACEKLLNTQLDKIFRSASIQQTQSSKGLQEAQIIEDLSLSYRHPSLTAPVLGEEGVSPSTSVVSFKPKNPLRITCLTIGSRGDVQPYIALCKGLIKEGHHCRIATHLEYKDWIENYGIEHREVGGDPAELMQICVEHGTFTLSFLREGLFKFRSWLDDLLKCSWEACQGSDLLIESPSAMAGIHIAEALQIPYFRAFTMTWTRTRAYPHAFAVPESRMGGSYNWMTYTLFDQVFWRAISGQVNRWRRSTLGLTGTNLQRLAQHKVPFLYCISPTLVPKPLDWNEWIHVTGYWFLDSITPENSENSVNDNNGKWDAPAGLLEFIAQGRSLNKKIVYIGFGSIVVSDPDEMTKCVVEAISQADVYAVLSKGWSDRMHTGKKEEKLLFPPSIFSIDTIDHAKLFPMIDAAVHHGGSGTTGASLRAGLPTVIKPFFGDQFFNADRVEATGVGSSVRKLTVETLSKALKTATTDEKQIANAKTVGEKIRNENGVANAIECLYRYMDYASTVITTRAHENLQHDDGIDAQDIEDDDDWSLPSETFSEDEAQRSMGVLSLATNIGKRSLGVGKDLITKKL
ncbi:UDP-Glycosyltransferase/glycogen phosphorylase [Wallemia mellicola CBS 633.66]|uniref:sterol 3beta-glucosyltransferase n=1 Tax=Wallemia mellicola (strain ATCC MYA-4683 / CBS 633.66) TaxID=671144 RepID=I4Y755_WALMC|nr:UDP-Glycosyltransferase/glycogen phosphorylase [Wallemia mellicola CBS 633.66]EIM19797.1 UDP-Glycosyltransferase/glycogen phosphorylase [Wallemia mellicola CBS 633.66]|eukprot:XP_006960131.1 UDP-Glycosyltransferase/glycogen phosphorylase [Wallemia mellicola CBS 633.66]